MTQTVRCIALFDAKDLLWQADLPMPEQNGRADDFGALYRELSSGDVEPQPDAEEWPTTMERIHVTGRVNEVNEKTYWYFLEVLAPKMMRSNFFAFAEGQEPLTLFWKSNGKHFCRRLTESETTRFCEASGLSKYYGM